MKYLKYFLLLLLFPVITYAKVNNLEVVSVEMLDKSDDVLVVDDPVVNGSSLDFNNRFYEVDDYIKYKIIMNNVSDEDIVVTSDYDNLLTKYFSYEVDLNSSEKILANQQVELTLIIKYYEPVVKEDIVSGHYTESQKINIGMVNGQILVSEDEILDIDVPVNPLTKDIIVTMFIVAFVAAIALIVLNKKKMIKYSLVLLLFIPLYISAVDSISVTSTVEIKLVKPNDCTYDGELVDGVKYEKEQYDYYYNSSIDGWRLSLKDRDSTDPVTSRICTTINGKPIASMSGTFAGSKASSIDLSSFETSHVIDMSGMFYNAVNINELDFITFDVRKVSNMNSMFYNDNIKEYDFSGFETPSLVTVGGMFMNNKNIEELDVSSFGSSNLTEFGSFIGNTPNLKKLNISNWDFGNYDNGSPFSTLLAGYDSNIVDLKADNVVFGKSMYYLFYNMKNLENLSLKNVDTSRVNVIAYAFKDLTKIKELDLSDWDTSNITAWDSAMANMTSLKHVSFKGDTIKVVGGMFKNMMAGSPVETIDLEDTTLIGDLSEGFSAMPNLKSVNFENINTSGVTSLTYLFRECPNVEELDLSDFDTENVTTMVWMLGYMPKLTKVDVTGFDFSASPIIDYMFGGTKLKTIDLSSWDVSKLNAMPWGLLYDTTTIEEVNLTGWDMRKMNQTNLMGRMLGGSSYALAGGDYYLTYILKKIDCTGCAFPNSEGIFQYIPSVEEIVLKDVDTSSMVTMKYMFAGARNLKSLDLTDFDTSKTVIMANMFYGDKLLESIDFTGFNTSSLVDTENMFRDTLVLQEIDLSSFDTSGIRQTSYMFYQTGATKGYAKNQESADFLNGISPDTLRFMVKE